MNTGQKLSDKSCWETNKLSAGSTVHWYAMGTYNHSLKQVFNKVPNTSLWEADY